MADIQIFNNDQFGSVRTVKDGDAILFCGADVARALGYAKPANAVAAHCKGATLKQGNDSLGRPQSIAFIPEGDVYRLIVRSNLPAAEQFEKWVMEEVLPTIRKTGGYVANETQFVDTYLPYADEQTRQLFSATLQTIRSLNHRIEQDKPKVLFADAVGVAKTTILVGELAKLIKQNGVDIGQNRLFDWMRDNGWLIKRMGTDYNMPTQKAMEMGLFEIKETVISRSDGHTTVSKTPKVTGKGQQYFINAFLGERSA